MFNRILILMLYVLFHVHPILLCPFDKTNDTVPFSTRAHWMRAANQALLDRDSPCPFAAFGTVIVNHTAPGLGELVCSGINQILPTGNPTKHGEIVAIENCTSILKATDGKYGLASDEVANAFSQLSLYTNAEACPMCASAIRWTGFKEYIFGTSINTLVSNGWKEIRIYSRDVFQASDALSTTTKYIPGILSNETDRFFKWQYNPNYPCPNECRRTGSGSSCEKILE